MNNKITKKIQNQLNNYLIIYLIIIITQTPSEMFYKLIF